MARYLCSYLAKAPLEELKPALGEILKFCSFDIIYHTIDYMMAREAPGKVLFSKLVTVEVLIDSTTATNQGIQVNLVVKNDELPLQNNNHCRQLFEQLQQALAQDHQWKLVVNVPT